MKISYHMLIPAFLAVGVIAACEKAPPGAPAAGESTETVAEVSGKPWATVLSETPQNGFIMGNPDAKIHVVEYASLTCPHCADFHTASKDALKRDYIAKGLVKYEFRSFILNPVDLAASVLARCFGPERFFALSGAFFENQSRWFEPFTKITKEDQKSIESVPATEQLKAYARLGKLDNFVRPRGITSAQFDACLVNEELRKELEAIQKLGTDVDKITGTPSFLINGKLQDEVRTWAALDDKLKTMTK
jgi:protein-disulfide isomerase